MADQFYLIGEFASMNKVSARMLRHYDKIRLLQPMVIKENGYRYYSEQQIAVISRIKKLRDCDFSLDEIAQIFENNSDTFFMERVTAKINDLNQQAQFNKRAITLLNGYRQKGSQTDFQNQYGISLTLREESLLLVTSHTFNLEGVEAEFDKLYAYLERKQLLTNGCAILLNDTDKQAEDRNQVGVPVLKNDQTDNYNTIVLPRSLYISTIHYGDYYNIGHAYNRIIDYVQQNGYSAGHSFMERYLIDRSHTADETQYVTEISTPLVTHNGLLQHPDINTECQ